MRGASLAVQQVLIKNIARGVGVNPIVGSGSQTQAILARHIVSGGIPGIESERTNRSIKGFIQLIQVARSLGPQKPGVCVAGTQPGGIGKLPESFRVLVQGQIAGSGKEPRGRQLRVQGSRPLEGRERFLAIARQGASHAQVAPRLSGLRLELHLIFIFPSRRLVFRRLAAFRSGRFLRGRGGGGKRR